MSAATLEEKAHALLGQMDSAKLAAVVRLLEAMVDGEPIADQDRLRFRRSQEPEAAWVSTDDVLAEYGFTVADFPLSK